MSMHACSHMVHMLYSLVEEKTAQDAGWVESSVRTVLLSSRTALFVTVWDLAQIRGSNKANKAFVHTVCLCSLFIAHALEVNCGSLASVRLDKAEAADVAYGGACCETPHDVVHPGGRTEDAAVSVACQVRACLCWHACLW